MSGLILLLSRKLSTRRFISLIWCLCIFCVFSLKCEVFFLQEMRVHPCVKCLCSIRSFFLLLFSHFVTFFHPSSSWLFKFSYLKFSFHSSFLPIFLPSTHTQALSVLRSTEVHLRNFLIYLQHVKLSNNLVDWQSQYMASSEYWIGFL